MSSTVPLTIGVSEVIPRWVRPEAHLRTDAEGIALKSVPIDEIFRIESETLGLQDFTRGFRKRYEEYISGLMNAVSVWLGSGAVPPAGASKRLADAVRRADEGELFSFISDVFYKDFKASYDKDMPLIVAVDNNKFNCYSSSVLFADTLTRLGKPVNIIFMPYHVMLAGERFAFETTPLFKTSRPVYLKGEVYPSRYKLELGVDKLVALAHATAGCINAYWQKNNKGAIESFQRALAMLPEDLTRRGSLGIRLLAEGRIEEALQTFKKMLISAEKALEVAPNDPEIKVLRETAQNALGRHA